LAGRCVIGDLFQIDCPLLGSAVSLGESWYLKVATHRQNLSGVPHVADANHYVLGIVIKHLLPRVCGSNCLYLLNLITWKTIFYILVL